METDRAWGSTPLVSHFGVGEFATHFRTYFSGWIGMFTGGTEFWILAHGQIELGGGQAQLTQMVASFHLRQNQIAVGGSVACELLGMVCAERLQSLPACLRGVEQWST